MNSPGPDTTGVLETTRRVVDRARDVRIDLGRLTEIAREAAPPVAPHPSPVLRPSSPVTRHPSLVTVPAWNRTYHWSDGSERTVTWLLVLDALNFCFWGEPKWRVEYAGEVLDGYWALAASLKRAMEEGIPLADPEYLARIAVADLLHILRGEGDIPLFDRRLANLREVGETLLARHDGRFATAVEAAGGSAVALVQAVVRDFPSFHDVATYDGAEVRLYKRAQILVGDLWGSFGGEGWGAFRDLDRLTAFADYKLPQILRHFGILEYSPGLGNRVDRRDEIAAGSAPEVEIRAATVWAVELLRQQLAELGRPLHAFQIDWCLWELAQRQPGEMKPYHRTRTVYY